MRRSDAATSDLGGEIAALRHDVKAELYALRADLQRLEHRLTTRPGGAIAVAIGIIFAAVRYLPPHG